MSNYPETTRIRLQRRDKAIIAAIIKHLTNLTKQPATEASAIRYALEIAAEKLGIVREEE
jgi:hypothetical protein